MKDALSAAIVPTTVFMAPQLFARAAGGPFRASMAHLLLGFALPGGQDAITSNTSYTLSVIQLEASMFLRPVPGAVGQ